MSVRTIKVDYLARVEGEGALAVTIKDGAVTDVTLDIFEPPGSSRRCCAGAGSTRRPTSPRASAGSVRWRTR